MKCGSKAKDMKKDVGMMMKGAKKIATALPMGKKGMPKKGK